MSLERHVDIVRRISTLKPNLYVGGFAAETENLIKNSKIKMQEKFCDMIVANDVSKKDKGFHSDFNEVLIIDKNGKIEKVKKNSKKFVASIVDKKIVDTFLSNEKNLN